VPAPAITTLACAGQLAIDQAIDAQLNSASDVAEMADRGKRVEDAATGR
jgi:hypothetical protein